MTKKQITSDELRKRRRLFLQGVLCTGLSLGYAGLTGAQDGPNSSLYSGRMGSFTPVRSLQNQTYGYTPPPSTNWYEVPLPPPKEVRVHDIITIRVDLGARDQLRRAVAAPPHGPVRRHPQRLGHLEGLRAVKTSSAVGRRSADPRQSQSLDRVTGDLETTEVAQVRDRRRRRLGPSQRQPGPRSPPHDPQQRRTTGCTRSPASAAARTSAPATWCSARTSCQPASRETRNGPCPRQLQTRLV